QALAMAESYARTDLIQKVQVQVSSLTSSFEDETNGNYNSQFTNETESASSLNLFGLSTENQVENSMVYVLSNVKKDVLQEQYRERMNGLLDQFLQTANQAKSSLDAGNKDLALEQLMEAKPVYSDLFSTWTVVQSLGGGVNWRPENVRDEINFINQQVSALINRPVTTLDDAAWWLANTLGKESNQPHTVNLSAITYKNTGISSEFANYLRQLLTRQIGNRTNWSIVETDARLKQDPTHLMTGTFWDNGEDVQVILNTREIESGKIVTTTEVTIPGEVIEQSGYDILPENYETALADLKAMKENKGDNRGLQLEVWTAKGQDQLVYEEGELLEVSLQVNLPSYIRILYHLNDGTRVLLVDSHFINDRDINKPYTLPYQFECVAPFGVEMMQVIAQSEPFERVETKTIDGIPYLTEDLEKFIANTRGFKIKKQEAQQTEEVLTITTIKKTE
ncbi:MAG: hypothetical protein WD597_00355, partial [Balneolaceae bacterium]